VDVDVPDGGMADAGIEIDPISPPANENHSVLLQSAYWACVKSRFGQDTRFFRVHRRSETPMLLLVLVRKIGMGYSLAYVPQGPVCDKHSYPFITKEMLPEAFFFISFGKIAGSSSQEMHFSALGSSLGGRRNGQQAACTEWSS
jgi:hypothetical protein